MVLLIMKGIIEGEGERVTDHIVVQTHLPRLSTTSRIPIWSWQLQLGGQSLRPLVSSGCSLSLLVVVVAVLVVHHLQ